MTGRKEQTGGREDTRYLLDEATFKKLFERYWKKLLGFCQHHTGDDEVSMDMVQDIFCSLWNRRERLYIEAHIEHYLFRAARMKISDYYREQYKQARHEHGLFQRFPGISNETEEMVFYRESHQLIARLVDCLPSRCREVYVLSRNGGLSLPEIAGRLSISEKTAEAHLSKALKILRRSLRSTAE